MKYDTEQTLLLLKAIEFAKTKHTGQKRDGGEEYIIHPMQVMVSLANYGVDKYEWLMVAVLHDTLEDTDTSFKELKENFGDLVARGVFALTHKRLPDETHDEKAKRMANELCDCHFMVKLIKLYDRLNNVSSMKSWSEAKKKTYQKDTEYLLTKLTEKMTKEELEAVKDVIHWIKSVFMRL